jgi:hypothetical protein
MKLKVDIRNYSNAPKILVNSAHRKYQCVLYASQEKQRILPYATWSDCFLTEIQGLTARYEVGIKRNKWRLTFRACGFVLFIFSTTNCRAAEVKRLPERRYIFKRRLEYLQGHIRRSSPTVGLEVSQSPTVITMLSQIDLRLHPLYLPIFIHDFHHRMDVRELGDVKWQRIDVRNWGVDDFQSVKCTQKAEIMGVSRDNKMKP